MPSTCWGAEILGPGYATAVPLSFPACAMFGTGFIAGFSRQYDRCLSWPDFLLIAGLAFPAVLLAAGEFSAPVF